MSFMILYGAHFSKFKSYLVFYASDLLQPTLEHFLLPLLLHLEDVRSIMFKEHYGFMYWPNYIFCFVFIPLPSIS